MKRAQGVVQGLIGGAPHDVVEVPQVASADDLVQALQVLPPSLLPSHKTGFAPTATTDTGDGTLSLVEHIRIWDPGQ